LEIERASLGVSDVIVSASMTIQRLFFPAVLPLLATLSLSAATWPHEGSDIPPDAKIVFGQLDNGVRYLILPNDEPPGRASLRLYMDVGSLMEKDDQQGMAHYLEHMAFNGSKHFPGGEMVEYFQRLGMGFGADTNAYTSFDQTVYMLELPKVEDKLIDEGLQLFRDYLDGMLLEAEEIDRERGIILSEKLARDSIDYRTMVAGYKFALPDSLLPNRLPIGTEETLKSMQRPRFVDFYETYYTPERCMVVAVGDFKDVPALKKAIKSHFGDAKARRDGSPDPDLGEVGAGHGLIAKLHSEMEAKAVNVSIEVVRSAGSYEDSTERRKTDMIRDLADMMLDQRFSKLAKEDGAPILSGSSYSYEYLDFVRVVGVGGECQPEKWKATITLLERELRRALEFGYTEAEFEEAKATMLKKARLAAEQADTRRSRDLATGFVRTLASNRVVTHPATIYEMTKAALGGVTPEDSLAALRADWKSEDIQIFVGGNLELDGDAERQIKEAFVESLAGKVEPPADETVGEFAYTDFGVSGKVAARKVVEDIEVTEVVFENGVRLNIKPTPFEKGSARVLVGFGGGKLEAPLDKPGLIPFAQSTFEMGGLVEHSVDDLRRLFASKSVSTSFSVGDEAFLLSGRTTHADLEAQLQLLAAHLVAPGFREEAERQFKKNLEALYTQLEHTAEGIMADKVVSHIWSGDPRFGYPAIEVMRERSLAEVKEWMADALTKSYLEVSVTGNVEPDVVVEAVAATFGALPTRAAEKPDYTEPRAVAFPSAPADKEFRFETEIPKAIATVYWPTNDMSDIQRTRRLSLLGSILDDRLRIKVREELGETYSPACYHVASDTFTGYGYMTAMIQVKTEQAEKIGSLVKEIADELAAGNITDDEFERAKKPQVSQLEQMRRDNRYWSQNVVRNSQEHPERLDWARSLMDDYTSITKEECAELARTYLGKDKAVVVRVIPEEGAGG
jgi:zinc protease